MPRASYLRAPNTFPGPETPAPHPRAPFRIPDATPPQGTSAPGFRPPHTQGAPLCTPEATHPTGLPPWPAPAPTPSVGPQSHNPLTAPLTARPSTLEPTRQTPVPPAQRNLLACVLTSAARAGALTSGAAVHARVRLDGSWLHFSVRSVWLSPLPVTSAAAQRLLSPRTERQYPNDWPRPAFAQGHGASGWWVARALSLRTKDTLARPACPTQPAAATPGPVSRADRGSLCGLGCPLILAPPVMPSGLWGLNLLLGLYMHFPVKFSFRLLEWLKCSTPA
jgi:hypothetical protein